MPTVRKSFIQWAGKRTETSTVGTSKNLRVNTRFYAWQSRLSVSDEPRFRSVPAFELKRRNVEVVTTIVSIDAVIVNNRGPGQTYTKQYRYPILVPVGKMQSSTAEGMDSTKMIPCLQQ